MCDANYSFTFIDVGAYGRECDKNVYNSSILSTKLKSGTMGIPPPQPFPDLEEESDYPNIPFVCVADDAFPSTTYIKTIPWSMHWGNVEGSKNI